MLTLDKLKRIMPYGGARIVPFVEPLNTALAEWDISPLQRQCPFLAHLAHESGEFKYMREIADGSAYEGRVDLGNTEPGDGRRYPGRGPMQVTGRKNTRNCSIALFGDERLLDTPELLEQPLDGVRAACWFWRQGAGMNLSSRAKAHGLKEGCDLNDVADAGDFIGLTLAINGGLNGLADRQAYLARAQQVLV